jgi:hypothetical protein
MVDVLWMFYIGRPRGHGSQDNNNTFIFYKKPVHGS